MPPRKRRQRGYIEQLPSGNYRAVTYAGIDLLTRRPRYIRETVKTYDAAKKALVKLQHQVDEDRHPKSDITVARRSSSGSRWRHWRTPPVSATPT